MTILEDTKNTATESSEARETPTVEATRSKKMRLIRTSVAVYSNLRAGDGGSNNVILKSGP